MSVLNPIVLSWDGPNRRIYLNADVGDYFPIEDLYHEYRNQRRINEDFRKYDALLKAEGNVPKGAGAFTPRYVVLLDGTKIVPFDNTTQINQLGDIITDDPDTDPLLYDTSTLTVPKVIYIKPSEAETIQLNSDAIEYSSYNGRVTVDTLNGTAGTTYPIGTPQLPALHMADANSIADERGLKTFFILGDLDLNFSDPVLNDGHTFVGSGKDRTIITIDPIAVTDDSAYYDAEITGTLDGNSVIKDCLIKDLVYVKGYIEQCVLSAGTIVLAGSEVAHFLDCWSGQPGQDMPIIDMGGAGQALALRNYNGGVKLINKSGPENVTIDLNSGQVWVDDTVNGAGDIVLRGVGKWSNKDTYVGTANVIDELVDGVDIKEIHDAHFKRRLWNKVNNTITLYDTDNVTPLHVFDTNEDLSDITPQ